MAAAKKGGLGRGLDALFADAVPVYDEAGAVKAQAKDTEKKGKAEHTAGEKSENDGVRYIKIHDIMPNLNQPRKTFQEDKIEELAASIKEHGIIQPIVVRKQENGYEIVAGERRWRAARKAELSQVPCLVRELTDEQNMLFAVFFDHALQWRDFFLWFQFGGPATEAQLFDRILANDGDFLVAAFLDREEMVFVFQQHNTLLGYFAGNLAVSNCLTIRDLQ